MKPVPQSDKAVGLTARDLATIRWALSQIKYAGTFSEAMEEANEMRQSGFFGDSATGDLLPLPTPDSVEQLDDKLCDSPDAETIACLTKLGHWARNTYAGEDPRDNDQATEIDTIDRMAQVSRDADEKGLWVAAWVYVPPEVLNDIGVDIPEEGT